ncbi:MAG: type II toxin-antitoxin system VapC family toxin [Acidobacteriota bacterium]|nr:type II toxin-antitoxin system VapC family toxin [Acidobacteriota bacterium]MDH3523321.1 type II toxin-antitoxin system VapC family toxin [Acidobacteriota bacterium]
MKLVDSSGWVELLTDGPLADEYAVHLEDPEQVLTPSIVLFEVYKWVKRERGEEEALQVAAQLEKTEVAPLTSTIALTAADASLEHGLAMADAIVYATAAVHEAELVTSDRDFASLSGVTYLEK